jgi:drug/metabolite transporter (DMT)-like permease
MSSNKNQAYLLIVILAIIWGSSFILIKRALDVYTPYQVGALRMFVAFLFMLPFIITHFKKIDRTKFKYLAATGFLGNGIPAILFPLAQTKVSSALAGMINTLTPIFTLIVGMLFFGMKVARSRMLGLIIGLLGAILLITARKGGISLDSTNSFALFIILATICYGFSVNILRNKLSDIDSIRITGFALFFAGMPFGILLFSGDFISRTIHTPGAAMSIGCILILGILGTSFSTILFNKLVKLSGALSAASVTYLIPIVAVLWGVLDNEVVSIYHLLGLGAILFGIYLVNRQRT